MTIRSARTVPNATAAAAAPALSSAEARQSSWRSRVRNTLGSNMFLLPILLTFVVLYVIPMVQSIYYSFTNYTGYSTNVQFVGLKNYLSVFQDSDMFAALSFTVEFAIGTTVVVTVLAIPLALVLNTKFPGRNLVRSVFFFPAIPSAAILGLVWGFILNPLGSGVINTVLHSALGAGPVPWLSNAHLAQLSTILVMVWAQTGWHVILYLAYLQSIPGEYKESAVIDGASPFQRFRCITLPLLTPALTVSTLLLMTNGLKVYDLPFTLTRGGPGFATRTITQAIIEDGIANAQIGPASALSVLFLIVVAAVILVQLTASRAVERKYS